MKHLVSFLTLFLVSFGVFGQTETADVKVGDIFTIQKSTNLPFDHIHFPRANFIIKRGGVANYKSLDDVKVKVVKVMEDDMVQLTAVDGKKFFNSYKFVKADMAKALEAGELEYLDLRSKTTVANN
jgi:hypothetical protein